MLFCIRYSQNGYTLGLEREPGGGGEVLAIGRTKAGGEQT